MFLLRVGKRQRRAKMLTRAGHAAQQAAEVFMHARVVSHVQGLK